MKNFIDIEKEVDISDELSEVILSAIDKVTESEKLPPVNICVLITDKEGIRYINKEYRNIDSPTDVLSFPYLEFDENYVPLNDLEAEKDPETGALCLGNMVLCMDVIEEHAKEYANTVKAELFYMTVHSMFHLLGYDHMNDLDKKVMRAKEKEIIGE